MGEHCKHFSIFQADFFLAAAASVRSASGKKGLIILKVLKSCLKSCKPQTQDKNPKCFVFWLFSASSIKFYFNAFITWTLSVPMII